MLMSVSDKKSVMSFLLFAVGVFAIVSFVLFWMADPGEFSWGRVLPLWGSSMYCMLGIGTFNGVSYAKYLYKVGLPLLFVVSLIGGILEFGFTWGALLLAAVDTLASLLIVMLIRQ